MRGIIDVRRFELVRHNGGIFLPLPAEAWRPIDGGCKCPHCKDFTPFWDTLAVSAKRKKGYNDFSWTVHCPDIHTPEERARGEEIWKSLTAPHPWANK